MAPPGQRGALPSCFSRGSSGGRTRISTVVPRRGHQAVLKTQVFISKLSRFYSRPEGASARPLSSARVRTSATAPSAGATPTRPICPTPRSWPATWRAGRVGRQDLDHLSAAGDAAAVGGRRPAPAPAPCDCGRSASWAGAAFAHERRRTGDPRSWGEFNALSLPWSNRRDPSISPESDWELDAAGWWLCSCSACSAFESIEGRGRWSWPG
jgi:hypothetical protein